MSKLRFKRYYVVGSKIRYCDNLIDSILNFNHLEPNSNGWKALGVEYYLDRDARAIDLLISDNGIERISTDYEQSDIKNAFKPIIQDIKLYKELS